MCQLYFGTHPFYNMSSNYENLPATELVVEVHAVVEESAAERDAVEASATEVQIIEDSTVEKAEFDELKEEQFPQFGEDIPEFVPPRMNVITFHVSHFTNEQYYQFIREMEEKYGLVI